MAGNNDEKIVRLPQLDRLTKSLDARNSTIIQNVHDELISAVEDVEKKLFSKDYNDLTNKPLVETVISEKTTLAEWDGDETGRSIGAIPTISCHSCIKVADLTLDQQDELFEKINANGCIVTIDPGDGVLVEQVIEPGNGHAFMDYCDYISPGVNERALIVLSGKKWSWYINHANQYIDDPGIYFYNDDGYKVVKLELVDEIIQYVSANDIFVNDKKLATEEFVNNTVNNIEIPEEFSGDYNDLENRPCYDDRIAETIVYEYDGVEEGKVTGKHGTYDDRDVIKVADFSIDQHDLYYESLMNGYKVTYEKNGEEFTYEGNRVSIPYSGTTHCFCAEPESSFPDLVIFAYDSYTAYPPYSSYNISEPGVYFLQGLNYKVSRIEFKTRTGEFQPLDSKYTPYVAGHIVEGTIYKITGEDEMYHGGEVVEGEEYVAEEGAEVFNSDDNKAIGVYSHVEGGSSISLGHYSHAEGRRSLTKGNYAHAEGWTGRAIGEASHSEGFLTEARGNNSHAEGYRTKAIGSDSHAEGNYTEAKGVCSHAEGVYTVASCTGQHAQGKYNIEDTEEKYAHIVGNGKAGVPSNAHTLDWDGNAWFAGKVTAEGTPVNDNDLVNKSYVDNTYLPLTGGLITGNVQIDGNLVNNNDATFNKQVTFNDTVTLGAGANLAGSGVHINADVLVNNSPSTHNNTAAFNGDITFNKNVTFGEDAVLSGNKVQIDANTLVNNAVSTHNKAATFNGDATFNSPTTLGAGANLSGDEVQINANTLVNNSPSTHNGAATFNGNATFNSPTTLGAGANLAGNEVQINANTLVNNAVSTHNQAATFNNTVVFNEQATFSKDLNVAGNVSITAETGDAWFNGNITVGADNKQLATMDDIIELEEDNLSMEGLIDETYPSLVTQDKTILGAINELARMLNGLTLMPITQEAYDALAEKNPNVIYIITE